MITDTVTIKGEVSIVVLNDKDEVVDSREINNMVVTTGKNLVANLIAGATAYPSHIALGTGIDQTNLVNTQLSTETAGTRKTFNSVTVVDNVATFISIWAPGDATGTYTETGIFNASSSGTMLSRTVFGAVTKTIGDKLVITWKIRVN